MRTVRSFVLRSGRLTKLQERALHAYESTYGIPFFPEGSETLNEFLASKPSVMEIGFGMGEATLAIARKNPDVHYLGVEVFPSGVGNLLNEIEQAGISNIRIIRHDAVEVISRMIPRGTLTGVHIFFPDPWPKKKHHKRRLIQKPFIASLLPLLEPGGYIYCVTDWEPYALHIREVLESFEELTSTDAYPWRPVTKFEQKGLAKDHTVTEILVRMQ